jgi:HD domain
MQPNHLSKQLDFIREIDKIKYIQRKTKLFNSNRPENDAEHSWHLAMMTIVNQWKYHNYGISFTFNLSYLCNAKLTINCRHLYIFVK